MSSLEHDETIGEYLQDLRDAGADLEEPLPFEQYLYFPFASIAHGVAEDLRADGFAVDVEQDDQRDGWIVYVTRRVVPTVGQLAFLRNKVGALTVARGGDYEGWNVVLVEEAPETMDETDVEY